jgi:hypothetical protein
LTLFKEKEGNNTKYQIKRLFIFVTNSGKNLAGAIVQGSCFQASLILANEIRSVPPKWGTMTCGVPLRGASSKSYAHILTSLKTQALGKQNS